MPGRKTIDVKDHLLFWTVSGKNLEACGFWQRHGYSSVINLLKELIKQFYDMDTVQLLTKQAAQRTN